ncbi:EF-hand domain-containing protein [Gymnodinialimonas ulvae]|uniref:EF-hand domain-containing protein n=1 Tax=Gymnodinialimonas ulvae TaxID=3126504 RepID=UPI0030ADB767
MCVARWTALALVMVLPAAAAQAQYEEESVQAFLAADLNGDERLTEAEFRTFIRTLADAGAPMSRRIRTFGAYGIAFSRTDANGDGLLSPAELRAAEANN